MQSTRPTLRHGYAPRPATLVGHQHNTLGFSNAIDSVQKLVISKLISTKLDNSRQHIVDNLTDLERHWQLLQRLSRLRPGILRVSDKNLGSVL